MKINGIKSNWQKFPESIVFSLTVNSQNLGERQVVQNGKHIRSCDLTFSFSFLANQVNSAKLLVQNFQLSKSPLTKDSNLKTLKFELTSWCLWHAVPT